MTPSQLVSEILEKAEKATGQMQVYEFWHLNQESRIEVGPSTEQDMAYLAACSPANIQSLLKLLQEAMDACHGMQMYFIKSEDMELVKDSLIAKDILRAREVLAKWRGEG